MPTVTRFLLAITAISLLSITPPAIAREVGGLLEELIYPLDFSARRQSSTDPTGENEDRRRIEPGDTLVLADSKGLGIIHHIWMTIAAETREEPDPYYSRKLLLRMFWDGEKNPSVECPVGDFFCVGHGMDHDVYSLPFTVTSRGRARNCFLRMPFGRSARIEMVNQSRHPVRSFYYYIDYQKVKKINTPLRFHAQYRQEFPCTPGKDYLILDAVGRGQYIGCNLSVNPRDEGWWGEGDDKIYIDGDENPTLWGTGTEDYFGNAWGLRPTQSLFYGCIFLDPEESRLRRLTAYRFHIADPIPFKRSIRVTIEHMGQRSGLDGYWHERRDDFSSVAYWYQSEPHKKFYTIPPAEERIPH